MPASPEQIAEFTAGISNVIAGGINNIAAQQLTGQQYTTRSAALANLGTGFLSYLSATPIDNYPVLTVRVIKNRERVVSEDLRFLLFYKLATNFIAGNFTLPRTLVFAVVPNYTVSGWPVESYDPQWTIFTRMVVSTLKAANPDLEDVSAWTETILPPEPEHPAATAQEPEDDELPIQYHIHASAPAINANTLAPVVRILTRQQEGQISLKKLQVLQWDAPEDLVELSNNINQMFDYGLSLLTAAPDKACASMCLALELKEKLIRFNALDVTEQNDERAIFHQEFRDLLHSEDDIMSTQRSEWKNITATILAALSVIGLIALEIHYRVKGYGFFATNSEKNIAAVEDTFDTCLGL